MSQRSEKINLLLAGIVSEVHNHILENPGITRAQLAVDLGLHHNPYPQSGENQRPKTWLLGIALRRIEDHGKLCIGRNADNRIAYLVK